jgi:hypothetical protein
MSVDKLRAQVIGSIWQAIAQSGVDLSSISQDQQEILVSKIADGVMVTMDATLGEEMPMTPTDDEVDELGEQVLWKGRPFLPGRELHDHFRAIENHRAGFQGGEF